MKRIPRWHLENALLRLGLIWMLTFGIAPLIASAQSTESQAESSQASSAPAQTQGRKDSALPLHVSARANAEAATAELPQPASEAETHLTLRPKVREEIRFADQMAHWKKVMRPAQPQRPLPLILFLIGLTVLVISAGLGILAFLLFGTGFPLGVITIFLWVVFGLTGLLGILLMISGLIAALAVSKKPKTPTPPSN